MKKTPLKRKSRMSPVSDKRRREMKIYSERRIAFLAANPRCQATMKLLGIDQRDVNADTGYSYKDGQLHRIPPATEIHHVRKRGRYYLDETTWMAVSRNMHRAIEESKKWARANGLLA